MSDYTWGNVPGSPYFDEREKPMEVHELSDLELLVQLSVAEDALVSATQTRKDILTEIRNRKDLLKEKLRRLNTTITEVETDNINTFR